MIATDSAGRNDTRNTRDNPRAAGAASDRGAQPSSQRPGRIVICQRCRKRLMQVQNGEWYHERNSSAFCDHTDGTRRKAIPLEIEVDR